mgnify:CR=1 FL=1|jgi:integration host factor subunit beta
MSISKTRSKEQKVWNMSTTTKKDLIDRIADGTKYKRNDVRSIVQAFLDCVISELGEGNRLEFRDFGVFELRDRAPRMAQNPRTLERVPVPARRTVKFKVGRLMKQAVDNSITTHEDMPVVETATKDFSTAQT